jgi:hypothetical protein
MPRGRPRLSDEEKARRAAEKEAKKAEKEAKRREAASAKQAPSGRGAGRPPKSLAERAEEVRTGKTKLKNLYRTPEALRAITFTKTLTHALPAHIVAVLPERSATRQAVLADPDLAQVVTRYTRVRKEFAHGNAQMMAGRGIADPYARSALAEISTLAKR